MDAIWDTYCGQTGESAPGPVPYTDARGGLYIRSAGGPAVERYAENGNCLGLVLLPGSGSGALFGLGPGKRFFSAGPYPTAIQESDAEGRILQTFGRVCRAQSCSLTAGEIHVPDGDQRIVAVGHGGSVFVLDQNAGAIVKFSRDGQVLDVIGKSGSAPGQMRNPTSITVDARGYLYVADTGNNRIEKFSPQGHVVAATGRFGTGPGRFNTPTDIAVDGGGNVYVIDLRNRRLQKFVPLR
jgi:streptogramin lyase